MARSPSSRPARRSPPATPSDPPSGRPPRPRRRHRLTLQDEERVLFVAGATHGARTLNQIVAKHLSQVLELCQLIHISGRRDHAWLEGLHQALPERLRHRYHLHAYLYEDLPWAMAAADLAVMRSGASVMGELPALGLPAVLVPYPYAGGHQRFNAHYLADAGAALVVEDNKLNGFLPLVRRAPGRRAAPRRHGRGRPPPGPPRRRPRHRPHPAGGGAMSEAPIPRRVHLVGIGGIHMSAIARILLAWGHQVSGSDLKLSPLTDRLRELGAVVHEGHDAANLGDAELVVYTAAAQAENPELAEARRRGLPVLQRAEMVARLMAGRRAIAVAGCHGKTSTTALIAFILREAGRDPTFLVGGEMVDLATNAEAGSGQEIVVEADEFAGAFLHYHPQIAVVTNIEPDHLDYYGSFPRLVAAFRQFLSQVPPGWHHRRLRRRPDPARASSPTRSRIRPSARPLSVTD